MKKIIDSLIFMKGVFRCFKSKLVMLYFSLLRNLLGGSSTTCNSFKEHESEACEQKKCPPDCNLNGKFYYHNEKIREDECQVW